MMATVSCKILPIFPADIPSRSRRRFTPRSNDMRITSLFIRYLYIAQFILLSVTSAQLYFAGDCVDGRSSPALTIPRRRTKNECRGR